MATTYKRYRYNGPVYVKDSKMADKQEVYTTAKTDKQAVRNIRYWLAEFHFCKVKDIFIDLSYFEEVNGK